MEEVYSWVEQYGGNICRQLRRMGSSVDWSRQVRFKHSLQICSGGRGAARQCPCAGGWSPPCPVAEQGLRAANCSAHVPVAGPNRGT